MSGKGSKRRPQIVSQEQFEKAWNKIFVRKETPKHAMSKVHKDKTKVIPRKKKYEVTIGKPFESGLDPAEQAKRSTAM